jgi:hypothetical protein
MHTFLSLSKFHLRFAMINIDNREALKHTVNFCVETSESIFPPLESIVHVECHSHVCVIPFALYLISVSYMFKPYAVMDGSLPSHQS